MELKPQKEKILQAMDKRTEYLKLAFISGAMLILNVLLFISGRYFITFGLICVASGITVYSSHKQYIKQKDRITDIADSFIRLEENYISCYQTSKDVYEQCDILLSEIANVIEDTKNIGFYIVLREDANLSTIAVDNARTERKMFYIGGYAYDIEEYISLYEQLLVRVENADTEAYKEHLIWKEDGSNTAFLKLLFPWILVGCLGLIHLAISLFLIA